MINDHDYNNDYGDDKVNSDGNDNDDDHPVCMRCGG